MDKPIKIILSILLFLCLADMPYGYYQLVRLLALVGFAVLAFMANKDGRQTEMIVYIVLAILFQPLLKIALGRELWNVVDVIVGVGLLVSVVIKNQNQKLLLKTDELWFERQPRGSKTSDTVFIPVLEVSAGEVQAIYLFAKCADGSKTSNSVYVAIG